MHRGRQSRKLKGASGSLYFGIGSTLAADTYFSGLIDDVRIYNQAVSPQSRNPMGN
ncbi:MAG: LamG-like jellyroll fold domain-containing protein [Planctomycetota bacterium]